MLEEMNVKKRAVYEMQPMANSHFVLDVNISSVMILEGEEHLL